MDTVKVEGVWWLPETPGKKIPGTLTYSDEEGASLSLAGMLGGMQALQGKNHFKTVFGVGKDYPVTLEECFTSHLQTSLGSSKLASHILRADRIYTHLHLNEPERKFNKIDISFDYLPEFINSPSLRSTLWLNQKPTNKKGLTVSALNQPPIKIGKVPRGKISAIFGWDCGSVNLRSITLTEKCFLRVELEESLVMSDILAEYVRPLQNLVTLSTDHPNSITELSVYNPTIKNKQNSKPIEIGFYEKIFASPIKSTTPSVSRRDMVFALKDLKRTRINKWLNAAHNYEPVMGIVFGQRYFRVGGENMLLNLVSAVEAFHRRRFSNKILRKDSWDKKRTRIIKSVKTIDQNFIEKILEHSNEPRLQKRLEKVTRYSGIADDLIPDQEKWNSTVRKYRHLFTHHDPKQSKKTKDYELIYWLSNSIAWILSACLMLESGFNKKEILELFNTNERYKLLKMRLGEILQVDTDQSPA